MGAPPAAAPDSRTAEVYQWLETGALEIVGRLSDASNVTLLATATRQDADLLCVYKPIRGERPLHDFPDGTLALREVAAHSVSRAAGWDCVPPTVLRDGPLGTGMVQQWIGPSPLSADDSDDSEPDDADRDGDEPDDAGFEPAGIDEADEIDEIDEIDDLVAILPAEAVPAGWLPVFRALDDEGNPLAVCHADDQRLALIAGFDAVVNNADRKAPHLLPAPDGRILGVDHGLTFHPEEKLRTILWGWAGRPLPEPVLTGLRRLQAWLPQTNDLDALLSVGERRVLADRVAELLAEPVFPQPPQWRTPIPWPPL